MINMTQAPEAALCREMEMCYVNISVITDYDVGAGDVPPVSHATVLEQFGASIGTLRDAVKRLIPRMATTPRQCECATARQSAVG